MTTIVLVGPVGFFRNVIGDAISQIEASEKKSGVTIEMDVAFPMGRARLDRVQFLQADRPEQVRGLNVDDVRWLRTDMVAAFEEADLRASRNPRHEHVYQPIADGEWISRFVLTRAAPGDG